MRAALLVCFEIVTAPPANALKEDIVSRKLSIVLGRKHCWEGMIMYLQRTVSSVSRSGCNRAGRSFLARAHMHIVTAVQVAAATTLLLATSLYRMREGT